MEAPATPWPAAPTTTPPTPRSRVRSRQGLGRRPRAHRRGSRVTETEVGDEESYYEVEVTLDDGSQVDVQLDEQFNVVGGEADDESEADDD